MDDIVLFHGSKGGIKGKITTGIRSNCDFGIGFYAGNNELQTQTLVCGAVSPVFYKLCFHQSRIPDDRILRIASSDWLNFVLYNRGYLEQLRGTAFYNELANIARGADIVIGPIADDGYRLALNDYEDDYCTDFVLQKTLLSRDIGDQIVAITQDGCDAFEIIEQRIPDAHEIMELQALDREERAKDISRYNSIRREFGRIGKTRSELIEEIKHREVMGYDKR